MVKLYGERYQRDGAEAMAKFVRNELKYLDYQTTLKWYERFRSWAKDTRDYAFLGANDRYFLLTSILGRVDALHPWVFDRCREVEKEPDGCLDLWARYHYKSTIITFAGAIQEVIRNPEITICIFSHSRGIATGFLRQIKSELENNEKLKGAYPDVFWSDPKRDAPKWAEQDGLTVKRKGNPKEATIEAWGLVDGQPTSKHFPLLIYDDVVTRESVTTPEMVKKTTAAWELSDNLGNGEETRKWHAGTRYSFADTYQDLIDRRLFKVRLYSATHNGRKNGNPVFITPEKWKNILVTQRSTVASQMLQNPAAGAEASFEMAWLKPYEIRPTHLNVYILCDPSAGRKKNSDRTAIAVIGVDVAKNKYLLDGYRHRMKLSERWDRLRGLHKKWSNAKGVSFCYVGYETFGMQGGDIDQFNEWMVDEKYHFPIEELTWVGRGAERSKEDRVNRLQPDIEGSATKFYFPFVVYREGDGLCSWKYDKNTNQIELDPIEIMAYSRREDGSMRETRTGDYARTTMQMQVIRQEQEFRLAKPIKAIDEDGQIYDLTRCFFEELRYFPFRAGHDDLIDAASRIYDMQATAPPVLERMRIETPTWQ